MRRLATELMCGAVIVDGVATDWSSDDRAALDELVEGWQQQLFHFNDRRPGRKATTRGVAGLNEEREYH
jgi:hypothetical protein